MRKLLLWLCLSLLVTACFKNQAPKSADHVFRMGLDGSPTTLDPQLAMDLSQIFVTRGLFEGLVTLNEETLEPKIGAATRWEISEDGQIYKFFLNPKGKWSDGQVLVAEDFAFAFRRALHPELAAPMAELLFVIENGKNFYEGKVDWEEVGVKVIDDFCLEIRLEQPVPYLFSLLAHPIFSPIPRKLLAQHGELFSRENSWTRAGNLVSNGPFFLKSWDAGGNVVLKKNAEYWNEAQNVLDEVIFLPFSDKNSEQNAFRCGEIDLTWTVPLDYLEDFRQNFPQELQEVESLGNFFYMCQCENFPLDDVHLRRALALAVNREQLCQILHRNPCFAAGNFVPKGTGGYVFSGNLVKFDPEEARRELAQSSYRRTQHPQPLVLTFNTSEKHQLVAQAVQEMWWQVLGISVELKNEEWKSFLITRRNGKFLLGKGEWIGDYNDPMTFLELFRSGHRNNFTRWKNAEFDHFLELTQENFGEKRHEFFQKAEEILLRDMPVIPLYFETHKHAVARRVKNWRPNILDYHLYQNLRLGD